MPYKFKCQRCGNGITADNPTDITLFCPYCCKESLKYVGETKSDIDITPLILRVKGIEDVIELIAEKLELMYHPPLAEKAQPPTPEPATTKKGKDGRGKRLTQEQIDAIKGLQVMYQLRLRNSGKSRFNIQKEMIAELKTKHNIEISYQTADRVLSGSWRPIAGANAKYRRKRADSADRTQKQYRSRENPETPEYFNEGEIEIKSTLTDLTEAQIRDTNGDSGKVTT